MKSNIVMDVAMHNENVFSAISEYIGRDVMCEWLHCDTA